MQLVSNGTESNETSMDLNLNKITQLFMLKTSTNVITT